MTGQELREIRESWGFSQSQLAKRLGIHRQTLSKWERGAQPIDHPDMLRLSLERLQMDMRDELRDEEARQ